MPKKQTLAEKLGQQAVDNRANQIREAKERQRSEDKSSQTKPPRKK